MAQPPSLQIRFDTTALVSARLRAKAWALDQLPFATAAALTDTAKQASEAVRAALPEAFTVRNKGLKNAITFEPADKHGNPIRALVGVRPWAEFLVPQALGGVKRAKSGSRVAVPTRAVQRTASGRVPARLKPRQLRRAKGFLAPVLESRGLIAVRNRAGQVTTFFTLVQRARIRARWRFLDQVEETVRTRLGANFARRAEQAFRTAR